MIGDVTAPPSVATTGAKARKVAVASMIGTTIEWYDFYLYGTASALVFSSRFFPSLSPTTGTLASFATYAVGFGARPIGGLIFGHFGDRIGRKSTLVVSLLIMGLGTMLIGLLPTYNTIGLWAPVLLVSLRLLQGIGLGGETGGATLMSFEHSPRGRSSLYGGFPQMGVPAGLIVANLVYLLTTSTTTSADFVNWAWRIPFLASAVLVALGLIIRLSLDESPKFTIIRNERGLVALPGWTAVKNHWPRITLTVLAVLGASTVSYVWTTFTLSYGSTHLGLSRSALLWGVLAGSGGWLLSIPVWSHVADRYGRRKVFLSGSVALVVLAALYFPLVDTANIGAVTVAFVGMGLILPITHCLQGSIMADLFPVAVRYSGMGWTLGVASVIGGTAPLIAQALFGINGTSTLVSVYVVGVAALSLLSATLLFWRTPQVNFGSDLAPAA